MIKLHKTTVLTLRDALNKYPDSIISSDGKLLLKDGVTDLGTVDACCFGKTYLVDLRDSTSYLVIGEYEVNKFKYETRMKHIPRSICIIQNEWELKE